MVTKSVPVILVLTGVGMVGADKSKKKLDRLLLDVLTALDDDFDELLDVTELAVSAEVLLELSDDVLESSGDAELLDSDDEELELLLLDEGVDVVAAKLAVSPLDPPPQLDNIIANAPARESLCVRSADNFDMVLSEADSWLAGVENRGFANY